MKFTTTLAIAALSASAAAENCFSYFCPAVERQGFMCDDLDCMPYREYIKQQLYSDAEILIKDGSAEALRAANAKLNLADVIDSLGAQ